MGGIEGWSEFHPTAPHMSASYGQVRPFADLADVIGYRQHNLFYDWHE